MAALAPDALRAMADQLLDLADELEAQERAGQSVLEQRLAPILEALWAPEGDGPDGAPTQAAVWPSAGFTTRRGLEKALAREPGLWRRLTAHRPGSERGTVLNGPKTRTVEGGRRGASRRGSMPA